jgi:hypothetical protein
MFSHEQYPHSHPEEPIQYPAEDSQPAFVLRPVVLDHQTMTVQTLAIVHLSLAIPQEFAQVVIPPHLTLSLTLTQIHQHHPNMNEDLQERMILMTPHLTHQILIPMPMPTPSRAF